MFTKEITSSDLFLDMPVSARELYFQLWMNADDDGFVNPRRIMRMIWASDDDLKILSMKSFVLSFNDGVIVITHRKRNNNEIRSDRYKPTLYQQHLKSLTSHNNIYALELDCIPSDIPVVCLDKSRVEESRVEENKYSSKEEEAVASFWNKELNEFISNIKNVYDDIGIELKIERKHASHFFPKGKIAKNRQEWLASHWYEDVYVFTKDILNRAKSIKYWNYVAKVSTLYWLRDKKEEILNLTSKIKEPGTKEHFEWYRSNVVWKEMFIGYWEEKKYTDAMYSDYLMKEHSFDKSKARDIRDLMIGKEVMNLSF